MVGEGKAAKKDPRAWSALTPPLADFILEAVSAMGFAKPTPVQAHVIPLFNGNKDVVVEVCIAPTTNSLCDKSKPGRLLINCIGRDW